MLDKKACKDFFNENLTGYNVFLFWPIEIRFIVVLYLKKIGKNPINNWGKPLAEPVVHDLKKNGEGGDYGVSIIETHWAAATPQWALNKEAGCPSALRVLYQRKRPCHGYEQK